MFGVSLRTRHFFITEMAINCVKAEAKRALSTPEQLAETMNRDVAHQLGLTLHEYRSRILEHILTKSLEAITPDKCRNFLTHSLRYVPRSLALEDILD